MEGFKEFTGKSLDDAIREACSYYDTSRERLEIDIVQDAKSGIFGLVGARKAIIRARRVQLRDAVDDILGRTKKSAATPKVEASPEAAPAVKAEAENKAKADTAPAKAPAKTAEKANENGKDRASVQKQSAEGDAHVEKSGERDSSGQSGTQAGQGQREKSPKPRRERHERHERHERQGQRHERGERNERSGNRQERNGNRVEADGNRVEVDGNRADGHGNERFERKPRREAKLPREQRDSRDNREGRDNRDNRRPQNKRQTPKPAPTEHMDSMGFGDDVEEVENVRRIPLEELDQERLQSVTLEAVSILTRPIVGEVPLEMKLHEGRVHVHLDCDENSGLLIGREGQTLASLQYITSRIVSRAMDAAVRVQLDAGDYRTRQDEKLSELATALAERVRATGKAHSTRPLSSYHRRIVHVVLQDATDLVTRSSGDGPLKRVIIQRKRG